MPFPPGTQKYVSTFKKMEYFLQEPGKHYVRFLEPLEKAAVIPFHYFQARRTSIQCLGDDCLVCKNNRRLLMENPGKKWREIEGLVSTSDRYAINILDRTSVKVCPKTECQAEIKADFTGRFPAACPYCNSILAQAKMQASNKVKVLSIPGTVAVLISQLEEAQLDEDKNPVPVTSYDFELLIMQKGNKKEVLPQVARERNDAIEVPTENYFDTSLAVIRLEMEEMEDFLKGTALTDIFAKRRAATETQVADSDAATPADISERVSTILDE